MEQLILNNDGFAFNPSTGDSYTLNSCARIVWQRLQQGESKQQVADFLSTQFGITQHLAERDIADFCQQLNLLGLTGEKR